MRPPFNSGARLDLRQSRPRTVVLALVLTCVSAGAADKLRQLSAAQIKAMVIGKAVTDEAHWSDHFYPDGTLKSLVLGEPHRGTWRVEGDSLCITRQDKRGRNEETECNEIWQSKDHIEYRRFGTTAAEGVLRDQW